MEPMEGHSLILWIGTDELKLTERFPGSQPRQWSLSAPTSNKILQIKSFIAAARILECHTCALLTGPDRARDRFLTWLFGFDPDSVSKISPLDQGK